MQPLNVGIIGTGNIAPAYIKGCAPFDVIALTACADILEDRSQAFAAEHGLTAYSVANLLARDDVDIVINLTLPATHAEVSLQIIEAGKHVYCEKPLAINRADGLSVITAAAAAGLRVGCAPDTFLGGGGQTARKAIDDGLIGAPIAATATWLSHGHESWHPNAGFYYLEGGGPMLDMGPYYVTALINLMGPVARVSGSAQMTFDERVATSEALMGQRLSVEVNTHVAGTLEFESGAIATVIMSYDIWGNHLPHIEIHGSEGSLSVPDPNRFDGSVAALKGGTRDWVDIPLTHSTNIGRGAGVADMAQAIQSGRPHRASGDLAFHALDIMLALEESSESGEHVEIKSTLEQPLALPPGLPDGRLEARPVSVSASPASPRFFETEAPAGTLNVGIIGTGNIAPAYIKGSAGFDNIKITACADILAERANAFAAEHGLIACSVDDMLARDDIDIVINLTIPAAHADISLQIIESGKHAYCEKPLAINRADGQRVVEAATAAGVRIGCAPDTFLGGGLQTARKAIDDGLIGKPIAATAVFMAHGPESWHPNPGIFYQEGAGPLFDMGPYYLTALVHLLGPVARVSASAGMSFAERVATSEALMGQRLPVEVNTHIAGTLEFAGGAIANVVTSFDVWGHHLPNMEVHGEAGSMSVGDPNHFHGAIHIVKGGTRDWLEMPHTHRTDFGRGAGVADMAAAIQAGQPHRASGKLALHVLDIMCALEESAAQGRRVALESTVTQPTALPVSLADGTLDF